MGLKQLISGYSSYNAWANHRIVVWLRGLDEAMLYKEIPSSFTSIDHTVQHILRVQKFWTAFILERDVSDFDWSVFEKEAGRILAELNTQSRQMSEAIMAFTEPELTKKLKLEMPWTRNELYRYEYVMHAINHSTYHRGQIITMARVLGITENIPSTEYSQFHDQL